MIKQFSLLILIVLNLPIFASDWLAIDCDSRSAAMGGAQTAIAHSDVAARYNPAIFAGNQVINVSAFSPVPDSAALYVSIAGNGLPFGLRSLTYFTLNDSVIQTLIILMVSQLLLAHRLVPAINPQHCNGPTGTIILRLVQQFT